MTAPSITRPVERLRANIVRVEREGFGRNADGTIAAARVNMTAALTDVVRAEDRDGVEAASGLADHLAGLRRRAEACGLLTPAAYMACESAAVEASS